MPVGKTIIPKKKQSYIFSKIQENPVFPQFRDFLKKKKRFAKTWNLHTKIAFDQRGEIIRTHIHSYVEIKHLNYYYRMISLFTILVDRIIASVFTTMGLRQDEKKMIII